MEAVVDEALGYIAVRTPWASWRASLKTTSCMLGEEYGRSKNGSSRLRI